MKRTVINDLSVEILKEEAKNYEMQYTRTGNTQYNTLNISLIPCGFDIETYNEFMYIWTFTIKDLTVIGYTWDDFRHLLDLLKEAFDLGIKTKTVKHRAKYETRAVKGKKIKFEKVKVKDAETEEKKKAPVVLPIFIHNIKFEWAFLKTQIIYSDPFYMDKANTNPLYVFADDSFLLIDSYKLYPMPLEDVAKAYTITKKAVGDLDYKKPRNIEDAKHLTEKELNYCICDTKILSELAAYTFDTYFKPYGRLPFTQNQMVKMILKDEYKKYVASLSDKEKDKLEKDLHRLTLSQDDYLFIRHDGFRGGYCASSECETDGEEIGYADLISAYCSSILHDYFPMSPYMDPVIKVDDEDKIDYYAKEFCCQMRLKFYNLRCKDDKLVKYESKNKVISYFEDGTAPKDVEETKAARKLTKCVGANRIWKAACISVSITELDWDIYKKVYTWDKLEVEEFKIATKGELPEYVKRTAIKLYGNKAKIKKSGKTKTPDYISAKTLVSNIFGAMVQAIDEEIVEGSESEWWSRQRDTILKPQWGVYVAAHVRKKLIDMILALGKDLWLYSDTDSIYYILNEKSKKLFKEYNDKIKAKNKKLCKKYHLDYKIFDDLGCWDDESNKNLKIKKFKTLGPKAYMYFYTDCTHPTGDWKFVLSGVPEEYFWLAYSKANPVCKLSEKDKEIEKVFTFFEKNTEIEYIRHNVDYVENTNQEVNGMICHCDSGAIISEDIIKGCLSNITIANALMAMAEESEDTRI